MMNGCVIPNTPIAVDFWNVRKCATKLFFLSHMHADHTCGLSSSWRNKIYTSTISAKLLQHKFQINPSLIVSLEVGESYIISLDEQDQETMTVKLIDSHHCPGSVMFLFEGYFGVILYTGDFRYHPDILTDLNISKVIDVLYLDNTYCHPSYNFPSREKMKEEIFEIIRKFKNHHIKIGLHSLGKEDLLVDIAQNFKTWIVVSPARYEVLKILELPNVFSIDSFSGMISIMKQQKVTSKFIEQCNKTHPTIGILPTALRFGFSNQPNISNIFIIPFSDHSSYVELCTFIKFIAPRKIIPIVTSQSKYQDLEDMSLFSNFLNPSKRDFINIPASVEKFMNSSNLNTLIKTSHKKIGRQIKHRNRNLFGIMYDSPSKDTINSTTIEMKSSSLNVSEQNKSHSNIRMETVMNVPVQNLNVHTNVEIVSENKINFCENSETVLQQIDEDMSESDAKLNKVFKESERSKVLMKTVIKLSNWVHFEPQNIHENLVNKMTKSEFTKKVNKNNKKESTIMLLDKEMNSKHKLSETFMPSDKMRKEFNSASEINPEKIIKDKNTLKKKDQNTLKKYFIPISNYENNSLVEPKDIRKWKQVPKQNHKPEEKAVNSSEEHKQININSSLNSLCFKSNFAQSSCLPDNTKFLENKSINIKRSQESRKTIVQRWRRLNEILKKLGNFDF